MTQLRTIYFVYDADGGILGKVKYWVNKNILKKVAPVNFVTLLTEHFLSEMHG